MEFPELGHHCHVASCQQLDFLPLTCQYCSLTHCKDHSQPDDHQCQRKPHAPQGSDENNFKYACSLEGCAARELVPVLCDSCSRNYCLQHRHPPDHACTSLLPQPPTKEELAHQKVEQIASALPSKPRKKAGHKDPRLAAKVQLMKLKLKAVRCGAQNMLEEDRCYLLVLLPLQHRTSRSLAVCISTQWSVGKALDAITDVAKVANTNNQSSEGRILQLYRHRDGSLLP
ncbi:Zinc finger AN1-type [Trinorchestia longiramus]|nr:Zinc finger AN1-type [Trinorchestia longiramus]